MPDIFGFFNCFSFYLDHAIHEQHTFPLWNPLNYCGSPMAGNPSTLVAYPPQLARSLLNFAPTPYSSLVSTYVLAAAHLLFAGVTAYYFARRRHRLSASASFTAALVFILSACLTRKTLAQWAYLTVVAWVPLIFIQLHDVVRSVGLRRKLFHAIAAGLAYGMALLGGMPQIAVCVPILGAGYVATLLCTGGGPLRGNVIGTLGSCAMAVAVAALVGMAVLLPAAEYTPLTGRAGAFDVYQANEFHYRPFQLLTYLSSYPGGELFKDVRGAGAVALFLAAGAMFSRRRRSMLPVCIVFLISLDLSLGLPLPFSVLLQRFCPFQIMNPSRTMVLTCFPLGLLAGYGVDAVVHASRSRFRKAGRLVVQSGVGAFMLAAAYAGIVQPYYGTVGSAFHPVLLMTAPVAAVVLALFSSCFPGIRVLRWGLAGLLVGEIAVWNTFFIPACLTVPVPCTFALPKPGESLSMPLTNRRASPALLNTNLYTLDAAIGGYDAAFVLSSRQVICSPHLDRVYVRHLRFRENAEGNVRQGLLFKRFFWLARSYASPPLPPKHVAFPAAATTFIEGWHSALRPVKVRSVWNKAVSEDALKTQLEIAAGARSACLTGKKLTLGPFKLPSLHSALSVTLRGKGMSRFYTRIEDTDTGDVWPGFVHTADFTEGPEIVLQIPLPDFRSVKVVAWAQPISEPTAVFIQDAAVLSDLADEGRLIRIVEFTPNTVALEVGPIQGARVLTFLDSAYPGWKVEVDGRPAPMLTAFDAFKAVSLEAGQHTVKFMFRPWKAAIGAAISVLSMAAGAFALWFLSSTRA